MGTPDVGDKFGIEFNGIMAGWVWSVEGGHATSDVISIQVGTGMKKGFYDWIKHFIEGRPERRDGTIVTAKADHTATARLAFSGALITEIGMPALDAASKDAAKMTLRIKPQATHATPLPPSAAARAVPAGPADPKPWLASGFRLKIDGIDCTGVTRIEAISIKQKVVEHAVGEMRTSLVITFQQEHSDFVIKGNNGDESEKGGTLEYLSSDTNEVLFSLSFKLTPDKVESASEQIRRVKVEMYCEDIKFNYGGGATWA